MLEHFCRKLNELAFHFLAPLLNFLWVLDDFEFARFDLVDLSLSFLGLSDFFHFLSFLYFGFFVVSNSISELFHIGGSLLSLLKAHVLAWIGAELVGLSVDAYFPGSVAFVFTKGDGGVF